MAFLVQTLRQGPNPERWQAAEALRQLGPSGRDAESALAALLANPDIATRIAALRAPGAIGPTRPEVRVTMERLQRSDPDPRVREWARTVLAGSR